MNDLSRPPEDVRGGSLLAGDLDLPALVLRESALAHNIAVMRDYCARTGLELAPHGKTSMSPELFARQIEAGAWAITAANIPQCRTMRALGVGRILLANVLVDPRGLDWVTEQLCADPGFEFSFYVDSDAGLDLALDAVARSARRVTFDVLVELGYPGGRSGCRSIEDAIRLAGRVHASAGVRLAGVAGFEGLMPGPTVDAIVDSCRDYLGRLGALVRDLLERGHFDVPSPIVTAGGSSYLDLVAEILSPSSFAQPVTTVLRSGCYITHDHSMFRRTSPFGDRSVPGIDERLEPAFELWATVWSRPEPHLAILGFGKRDAPYDYGLPIPLKVGSGWPRVIRDIGSGAVVTALNDQHAFMTLPDDANLSVGDVVVLGISHPCTAFDKWRSIPIVDDHFTVLDTISTHF